MMRDSMAKSLYSALFDWIILHINHAMLNRRDMEESVPVSNVIHSGPAGTVARVRSGLC